MSSLFPSADNPRPRQVTVGATLAVTGGLVLLFALVDLTTRLESVEVTQALHDGLRSLRLSGDVSVEQARDILRYTIMVFAVLSAAAVVFGIFTLMRDRAARIALTAVIGTIGVAALLGGPATWLISMYVGVSVALLWSRSAREWFAGTQASGASAPPRASSDPHHDVPPVPPGPPGPPPGPPPGWSPPPYGPPPGWGPPPPGWRPPPGWIPPAHGPPPGWPHVPPPPPGWSPAGGWRPPPVRQTSVPGPDPDDGDETSAEGDGKPSDDRP
jgi:hypothetical protein